MIVPHKSEKTPKGDILYIYFLKKRGLESLGPINSLKEHAEEFKSLLI
jgi:hypothetical protein